MAIVGENASARFGGESILPLHYFTRLRARGIEAWLFVHSRVRDELEAIIPDQMDRVFFVPDLWRHKVLYRIGRLLPSRIAVNTTGVAMLRVTQRRQRKMLRAQVPKLGIQIVHIPAPVSPKFPSAIYDVGAPVIFGPMNGGMTFPPGFPGYQGAIERIFVKVGRALSPWVHRFVPGKRRAAALLVANERTRQALPKGLCPRVIELVENAVDLKLFEVPAARTPRQRVRFVYLGRLVDFKGVDILLEALAQALAPDVQLEAAPSEMELHVIGDGPDREELQAKARTLGIADRVVFHGFVPQKDCPGLLADADALVLPSLHECGGAVVLEAMAMGVPVIATRWGGPADYLDDETGILIDPTGRDAFVEDLRAALVRMAGSPALREQFGERGRARVLAHYDWDKKIDRILEIYGDVMASSGTAFA